ncbi:MAG: restriction endonuclease subunit S [Syntrophus sp. (in: bacteria)]|nr:restriction endonuclease subunit S [Syntrophus sp. (in: bacteria)]
MSDSHPAWKKVSLGDCVCLMKSGLSRKLSSKDIGIPMLRSNNIGNKYCSFNNIKFWYVDDPQGARTSDYILNEGDLLVNFINSIAQIGKACLYKDELGRDCLYTTNILRLKPNSKIESEFLYYITQTSDYSLFVHNITKPAVNQASFTTEDFKKYTFFLPNINEQIAIVGLLSTWDQTIENTERLIVAKGKWFCWFSNTYLFGDNYLPKDTSKKTRWFSIPEHWKIVTIGDIAREIKSVNGSENELPVLSCTKYDGLVDSLSYFDKQVFSMDTSSYKVVSQGQFAYATNHIEEGSIGYQNIYEKGLVSPMYTVFQTKDSVDDIYLYQVLKTNLYTHIFKVSTSASVDRRGSLRWKEFAKLPIPLPPMKEQQKISALLNTAKQEIDLLKEQLEAYRKQKRGLMQKLLTGRIKLSVESGSQRRSDTKTEQGA